MKIKFSTKPGRNSYNVGDIVEAICISGSDSIFKPNQMFTVTDFIRANDGQTFVYLDIQTNDARLTVRNLDGLLNKVGWSTIHFKLIKSIS